MNLEVNTNNVIIQQLDQVESGEYNVTQCNFTFSNEYEGLTKKAVFTGEDGTAYLQTIVDNKCSIPSEILEVSQVVEIGVYAYAVENEELILRYSPEPTDFFIHEGSYKEAQNSTPPTPSEVEQLQAQITSNKNDIEEIQGDVVDINQDIVDIKAEQITQNENIQTNANNISTINEQISDINETITNLETNKANVTDLNALTERVSTNERDIDTINGHIRDINQNIDDLEQDLTNYSLITETGSQINLNINSSNFQMTAILKDKNGNTIYTSNIIDLPLETMVVGASYDNTTKEVVLTLQNGTTLRFSVADLVSGLVSETQLQTILSNYYTKTEVNNLLNTKANQTSLDTTNQNVTNLTGRVSTNEEDIADIKEEQTTQNANIEELQNQVETLQEDLDNAEAEIDSLEQDVEDLRGACYKVEGTGTDITLNNTAQARLLKNELSGNTEQEQLSGKNLFDKEANVSAGLEEKIVLETGVRVKQVNQGIYKYVTIKLDVEYLLGKTITIHSIITNSSSNIGGYAIFFGTDSNPAQSRVGSIISASGNNTFNIPSEKPQNVDNLYIFLYSNLNGTGNANDYTDFTDLQIELGSTATSYEPYCGGIPSPNPDFPQQIKNVTGNANVKIQNKNLAWNGWAEDFVSRINNSELANLETYENRNCLRYNAGAGSGDYDNKYIFKINWKENTQYTLSYYAKSTQGYLNLSIEYTDGTTSSIDGTPITNWAKVTLSSTANKTIKYIRARFTAGATYIDLDTFMVEENSTATDFVPHQEQNLPFTFAEGQFLADNEELQDGEICKTWYKENLANLEWYIYNVTDNMGNTYGFAAQLSKKPKQDRVNSNFAYCNILEQQSRNNVSSSDSQGFYIGVDKYIYIKVNQNLVPNDTIEELVALLTSKNAKIQYKLDESEFYTIPYNATQQAQYDAIKNARSYDDITYITSTSDELGFDMNVVAVANANKVIDKELQEIKSAVIALGGDINV